MRGFEMVKRVTRLCSYYKLFYYAEVLPIKADMNYESSVVLVLLEMLQTYKICLTYE
jgi:hypothetical protein